MGILDTPPVPYSWVTKGAKPVILDTDWWTDTGDISAARAATNLEKLGAISLEAVTINVTYSRLPESLDAFLKWDGRPFVPIGKSYTSHTPTGTAPTYPAAFANGYAHDIGLDDVPDAVTVMRTVLAAATQPVHIVAIGYLNNVADLLTSPADDISDLTGAELVEANETVLWVAAGRFPSGDENNLNRTTIASAAGDAVARTWPSTLYWFGAEIGDYAMSGAVLRSTYPDDLLWIGYYNQLRHYGRPSWDNMCLTACALDQIASGEYTTVRGTCTVNPSTGANSWVSSSSGPHYYLVKAKSDYYYEVQQAALMVPPNPQTTIVSGATMPHLPSVPKFGLLVSQNGRRNPLDASATVNKSRRASRSVDDDDLLAHFHADDLSNWNDSSTLAVWQDRTNKWTARQIATSGQRPTYKASIGSKTAVGFFGTAMMTTDPMVTPTAFTLYATVRFSSVPASQQSVVSWDNQNTGGTYPPKAGRLVVTSAGKPAAIRYEQLGGITDTAASALSSNTWYVLACRFDPVTAKAEVFVNGAGTGGTALTGDTYYANGGLWVPLTLGSRYSDALNEALNGYVHEIRVYSVAHSNAQVSAVTTAMS